LEQPLFFCCLAVSANGEKLKLMLIFKGTPTGRIATREFRTNHYRDRLVLACQESAWQDRNNILLWIDRVLVPYLQEKAAGAPAAILLDEFRVHWTEEVGARFQALGITPYRIPGGCTGLAQPIDVGIGKPFKDYVRAKWWEWLDDNGPDDSIVRSATRELGCQWVAESWETNITQETVQNSWRKTGFSYFPEVED
jgi:hypothetical protein